MTGAWKSQAYEAAVALAAAHLATTEDEALAHLRDAICRAIDDVENERKARAEGGD